MAIQFDASPYIRAHGKAPKGNGRWAFSDSPNPEEGDAIDFTPHSMTLTEAKRWMKNYLATTIHNGAPIYERGENIKVYILS